MSLTGKVAIVTGGNSGIGRAIALELARQGAQVVINYVVNPEATAELEKQIAASGGQAVGVRADVSKVAELQALVDSSVKAFGRVDILVNNAGVETRTSLLDTTEEQYDRVLGINLKSAFFATQIVARQMIKQGGGGRIHHLGARGLADAGQHRVLPVQGRDAHAHAHRGARAGAPQHPHRRRRPGAVATPINTSTMQDPALLKKLNDAIPLGRMARPEEIASVVAFLADTGASYMTATTVFPGRRADAEQSGSLAALLARLTP